LSDSETDKCLAYCLISLV